LSDVTSNERLTTYIEDLNTYDKFKII